LALWLIPRLGGFLAQYPDIRLRLLGSNDRSDLRSADIDVCFHYTNGDWKDCWFKKWSDVLLFPVVSPTLINERPIRTIRDLGGHVLLHGDDGREWQTWLAAADALDLPVFRLPAVQRCAAGYGSGAARAWGRARRHGYSKRISCRWSPGCAIQALGASGQRLLRRLQDRNQIGSDRDRLCRLAVRRGLGPTQATGEDENRTRNSE
jgi:DNA-binding transcriptional LysR family regulator